MTKAIIMHKTGGVDVLTWEPSTLGDPGPGEARVRHKAIGLNFIDIYHRMGLYPLPSLPSSPGMEASGIVEAIGEEVDDVRVGDRVAYAGLPPGAYAEARLIPAHRLVKLPENIDDETAAAMMLQGMTARYLLHGCFAVGQGHTILIHAAAGGVGLMVCQWANLLGAQVIGTVGSPQKAEVASAHGCHYPILYKEEDFAAKVKDITQGQGVDVVYDSIGQPTFMKSLTCLRPLGTMVSFGQSAGAVEPFDVGALAAGGSLFLTRPSLMNYTAKRKDLLQHAGDLFNVVAQGAVKVEVNQRYALKDAAKAHQDLEGRKTTGSSILIP